MNITKELLEKYNIHEHDEEMFYMDNVSPAFFAMWPTADGWYFNYDRYDVRITANSIIKTEEELITALKFSKLL
jgi:hypothetical protein